MALNATWKFSKFKGDANAIRAVDWVVTWTDPEYPGTEVLSSGVTTDSINIAVATATHREIELAIQASLGSQMDAIRTHVAQTIYFKHQWEKLQVVDAPKVAAAPISDDVNAERRRRILAGKVINGVRVTGSDEDARNLTNLALAAQVRLAGGDKTTITVYRDGHDKDHGLTPDTLLALWQAASAYVSALYAASWKIKAMTPIPADFADNKHWPAE